MAGKLRYDETTGKYTTLPECDEALDGSVSDNKAECPFCGKESPETGNGVYTCRKCREPFSPEEEND